METRGLSTQVLTDDVSAEGLFLRTDLELAPMDRVYLDMELPFGVHLSVPAMVTHRRKGTDQRAPGVGVRLFPLDELEQAGWDQFLGLVASMCPADGKKPAVDLDAPDPIRRQHTRVAARLKVEMSDGERTWIGETRDVSAVGLFVITDADLPPGKPLSVHVEDTGSRSSFELSCVVARQVRYPAWSAGLGLEITS